MRNILKAPILMYHDIGPVKVRSSYRGLTCPAILFLSHVLTLKKLGYEAVTVTELVNGWHDNGELPIKPVALTFDDAMVGVYRYAKPILAKIGWKATVYVATAHIGKTNGWDSNSGNAVYKIMTNQHILGCAESGFELGSHSSTHCSMAKAGIDRQRQEIQESKKVLEDLMKKPVSAFCYPYGSYSDLTVELLQECGYSSACSTNDGLATSEECRFGLSRVLIQSWRILPKGLVSMINAD